MMHFRGFGRIKSGKIFWSRANVYDGLDFGAFDCWETLDFSKSFCLMYFFDIALPPWQMSVNEVLPGFDRYS